MFNSLKNKIIIPSITMLILLIAFIIIWVSVSINRLADELAQERMDTAIQMAYSYMDSLDELNTRSAYIVASSIRLIRPVRDWNMGLNRVLNREAMLEYLLERGEELGLDNFILVDQNSSVILRTYDINNYGDRITTPNITAALQGDVYTIFSVTDDLPMGLSTAAPVIHDGVIIGAISTIRDLDTNEFVDYMSEVLSSEITVYSGGTRVATTIVDESGNRIVGTDIDPSVMDIVLSGRYYRATIELYGEPYYAYYFPLIGWGNVPVGIFYLGFSVAHATAATASLIRNLIIIGVLGLVVAAVIMLIMIVVSLKPLDDLTSNVKAVAAGNLNVNISSKIQNDEIGVLTHDVYGLVDVIKGIIGDLTQINREFNINGNIDYRADAGKYQNSFKDLVVEINSILESQVKDTMSTLDVLNHIVDGDFDVTIEDLPGTKIILPHTLREVTENLKEIYESATFLAGNAAAGKLDVSVDPEKYKGSWSELVQTLNGLIKAVEAPITETRDAVAALSKGEFDTLVNGNYTGDFLSIKNDVNELVTDLAAYIGEIANVLGAVDSGDLSRSITMVFDGGFDRIKQSVNGIVGTLNKTMTEINSASAQVLSGAKQISSSAMDLANGATEQASSVQEITASIDQIVQQTNTNAENSQNATILSNKSTESARAGNEDMGRMLDAMSQIKEASNGISQVIKVIQDIAFQTNLLALNAAVEAARAGEHGKGFSVVAEEVRSLAARSQEAATETTGLIEDSIDRVESGSSIAESTAKALDVIVLSAAEVVHIIEGISEASHSQAESIGQLSAGLNQISQVVQSNSSVSEETAAAAEELNSQAELLRQLVSFFKV